MGLGWESDMLAWGDLCERGRAGRGNFCKRVSERVSEILRTSLIQSLAAMYPTDRILVKHMFRFAATKMRALYLDRMDRMEFRDNCMWYWKNEDSLLLYALENDKWEEYEEYINLCNHKEHSKEIFQNLAREFDIEKCNPLTVSWLDSVNKFVIHDGAHRYALLKIKGHLLKEKWIPMSLLKYEIPESNVKRIGDLLKGTVGYALPNSWNNRTEYGYHSMQIFNAQFQGQRKPWERLDIMRKVYDFTGKKVLDLGCNTGGMLLHLFEAGECIGVDYDIRCIEAAREIHKLLKVCAPCSFERKDLENSSSIHDLMQAGPDVVFLLSMGSWIKGWRGLYDEVLENLGEGGCIFLEINNEEEGASQIGFFAERQCFIQSLGASLDDTTGNTRRRLFCIRK
jgi:hypothetical protein